MSSLKYSSLENRIRPYANTNFNGHVEIIAYTDYSQIEDIYKAITKENKLLTYDESNELELEKIKLESKKEDTKQIQAKEVTRQLEIQLELKKLEISERNEKIVKIAEPVREIQQDNGVVSKISKAVKNIVNKTVLTEEEKANFTLFLEQNILLYYAKTNEAPLVIQDILDIYLVRPKISPFVKGLYVTLTETFIEDKFPRENQRISKRRVNGKDIRGWYNFKIKQN
jgi:acylphosphatase